MNPPLRNIKKHIQPQQLIVVGVDSRSKIESTATSILFDFLSVDADHRGIAVFITLSGQQVQKTSAVIAESARGPRYSVTQLHTTSDQLLYNQRSEELRSHPDVIVSTADRFLVHLKVGNIRRRKVGLVIVEDLEGIHDAGYIRDLQNIYQYLEDSPAAWLLVGTSCKGWLLDKIRNWLPTDKQLKLLQFTGDIA